MNRLILFLIRLKLGVRKNEEFRFTNQKSKGVYYIDSTRVWKIISNENSIHFKESHVGVNWLLNSECKIEKVR